MVSIFLDLAILLILLYNIRSGYKRGFIMSLAGVVGLVCGIYGGSLAADLFSPAVSGYMIEPVRQAIEAVGEAKDKETESAEDSGRFDILVAGVAKKLKLPQDILAKFSQNSSMDDLVDGFGEKLANEVAVQLARIVVFAVAFAVIEIVVFFLMRMLNAILKLPIIGLPNRIGGALLGGLKGGLFVAVCLWMIIYLIPTLTKNGPILSQETIDQSYVVGFAKESIDKLI